MVATCVYEQECDCKSVHVGEKATHCCDSEPSGFVEGHLHRSQGPVLTAELHGCESGSQLAALQAWDPCSAATYTLKIQVHSSACRRGRVGSSPAVPSFASLRWIPAAAPCWLVPAPNSYNTGSTVDSEPSPSHSIGNTTSGWVCKCASVQACASRPKDSVQVSSLAKLSNVLAYPRVLLGGLSAPDENPCHAKATCAWVLRSYCISMLGHRSTRCECMR